METVYIETSFISYLTAFPARDLLAAAWQNATTEWWHTQRHRFELFTSHLVVDEAAAGHPGAAKRRLKYLDNISLLPINEAVTILAELLLSKGALPRKAADDALHLATAAYHGVDYLLTWNCRHLDNAQMKPIMRSVCTIEGYTCPEICTPIELMGDNNEG